MTPQDPKPDVAVSLEFLRHHFEASQGWAQVVAIDLTTGELQTAWAPVAEIDSLGSHIEDFTTNVKLNVYFGVAPRVEKLPGNLRGEIGDCLALPCLWNDIDIHGPAHKAENLPMDEQEAWDKLIMAVGLEPNVLIHTGHGLQPLYYVEGGIHEGNEEYLKRWEATWKRVSAETGYKIDPTWDVPRILRLPGSLNRKVEPVLVTYEADWDR